MRGDERDRKYVSSASLYVSYEELPADFCILDFTQSNSLSTSMPVDRAHTVASARRDAGERGLFDMNGAPPL